MKYILLQITLILFSGFAISGEFKLASLDRKSGFIEVYVTDESGSTFDEVFNVLSLNDEKIFVRILGGFPRVASNEIMVFLNKQIPVEIDTALKSSGNLHNPTLAPVVNLLLPALQSTHLYRDISHVLDEYGYSIVEVTYEKLTIYKGAVTVAEFSLRCIKNA